MKKKDKWKKTSLRKSTSKTLILLLYWVNKQKLRTDSKIFNS